MGIVKDLWKGVTGETAAEAATQGSEMAVQAQREALDYLRETGAPALEAQRFGLTGLTDYFSGNQQQVMDAAMQSPFYQQMVQQGEEAVLRNAAATGGLRGGAVQQGLAGVNQQALQSAVGQHLGGLQSLAGVQTNTGQVGNLMQGIGQTQAAGVQGAAQAQQAGMGNLINLGFKAYGAGMFSDIRLKTNVVYKGDVQGHEWYEWEWNDKAKALGLEGKGEGVIADKVEQYAPEFVGESTGFKTVDYEGLLNG